MKRAEVAAYGMVAAAACSWGTWRYFLLAAERLAPGLDARVESAVVMLGMTVVTFGVLAAAPSLRTAPGSRRDTLDWAAVAWLGVADAMNVMLLFAAYERTSVAIAVTTHYLAPLLVAVSAPFLLREHARGAWLAAAGGAVGLALLLRPWDGALARRDVMGALAGAGSALFYASNVLVNKRFMTGEPRFTAIELMAYHGVVATPLLFAITPLANLHALTWPATLVLSAGAIVPGALGGILFILALRHVRAAHASTITLLEPVVAVAVAVALLHERLTAMSYVGAALVLGCAGAVAYADQR